MGVRAVLGRDPSQVLKETEGTPEDELRRHDVRKRIALYQDAVGPHLRELVHRVFQKPQVRGRIEPFVDLASSFSLLRRIVDEVCRHTYCPGPVRVLDRDRDTRAYARLVRQTRQNKRLDLAMRLMNVTNVAWLHPRYLERGQRFVLDVLTRDQVTVIPDPEDPLVELGLAYRTGDGGRVFWDDEEVIRYDSRWRQVARGPNTLGLVPFVALHRRERWGTYEDATSGADLVAATMSCALLLALALKHLKSQGFRQPVFTGDTDNLEPEQTLDEESALVVPDGANLTTLDLKSDAKHYQGLIEFIVQVVAANYGVSRNRLEAHTRHLEPAEDTALLERRQEQVQIAAEAEHDLLRVWGPVSRQHPDKSWRLGQDPEFETLDFGELEARLSLKDQIQLWDQMERMGIINVLDVILARNPELEDLDQALDEYRRNLQIRAMRVEMERRLNLPHDGGIGRAPEDNGAEGPSARPGLEPGNGVRGFAQAATAEE